MMTDEKGRTVSSNTQELEDVSEKNAISEKKLKELIRDTSPITHTLVVKHEQNFTGELTFAYWWNDSGTHFHCQSLQYRIIKGSGQSGGNKANLHFSFDSLEWWGNDSPDALWQDGDWHSYSRAGSVRVRADKHARVFARFTFDSSGNDPTEQSEVWVIFPN